MKIFNRLTNCMTQANAVVKLRQLMIATVRRPMLDQPYTAYSTAVSSSGFCLPLSIVFRAKGVRWKQR